MRIAFKSVVTIGALVLVGSSFAAGEKFVADEVVVKTRSGRIPVLQKIALQAVESNVIRSMNVVKLKIKGTSVQNAIAMLKRNKDVIYAEPNFIGEYLHTPNDPLTGQQYGLTQTSCFNAWDVFKGNSNIVIAVLDSGLTVTHEDIVGKLAPGTLNLETDTTDVTDDVGHGSHCIGIAGANTNNGKGVAAASYSARILALKMGDVPTTASSAKGLVYAADRGAKIASMSYRNSDSQAHSDAVKYAVGKGMLLFAAAGNDNFEGVNYPAKYPEVIAAAATDATDKKADFSNYGADVEIAAPGDEIMSLDATGDNKYVKFSGTSMACPFAASIAALVWGRNPSLTNTQVQNILYSTADDVGPFVTKGRLNALRAVNAAQPLLDFDSSTLLTQVGGSQGTTTTPYPSGSAAGQSTDLLDTSFFGVQSKEVPKLGAVAAVESVVRVSQTVSTIKNAKVQVISTAPTPVSTLVFAWNYSTSQYDLLGTTANRGTQQTTSFGFPMGTFGHYMNSSGHIKVFVRNVAPARLGSGPFVATFNRISVTGSYDPLTTP